MATGQISLDKPTSTELIPLGVQAHNSAAASNSAIEFKFTLSGDLPDHIEFVINAGSKNLLSQQVPKSKLTKGANTWKWDGFDKHGIFSSKELKQQPLEIVATGQYGTTVVSTKQVFTFEHSKQSWVDIQIDNNTKLVKIELRVNIKDGGASGVGELPPGDALKKTQLARLPEATLKHQRLRNLAALKNLVTQGIQQYWSRAISLENGDIYQLSTSVVLATKNAMDDIAVVYNTNNDWIRSSNPGRVRGVYSLFGNIVARERIAYNVGFINLGFGWSYIPASTADLQFKHTAAHEIGHEILSAYGGESYSYTHRGSSSIFQKTKAVANGGVAFPSSGEVDLMKYYNGTIMRDLLNRSVASNYDARSLIYLTGIKLK